MKIVQEIFTSESGWKSILENGSIKNPQLVLVFGNREIISQHQVYDELKNKY